MLLRNAWKSPIGPTCKDLAFDIHRQCCNSKTPFGKYTGKMGLQRKHIHCQSKIVLPIFNAVPSHPILWLMKIVLVSAAKDQKSQASKHWESWDRLPMSFLLIVWTSPLTITVSQQPTLHVRQNAASSACSWRAIFGRLASVTSQQIQPRHAETWIRNVQCYLTMSRHSKPSFGFLQVCSFHMKSPIKPIAHLYLEPMKPSPTHEVQRATKKKHKHPPSILAQSGWNSPQLTLCKIDSRDANLEIWGMPMNLVGRVWSTCVWDYVRVGINSHKYMAWALFRHIQTKTWLQQWSVVHQLEVNSSIA